MVLQEVEVSQITKCSFVPLYVSSSVVQVNVVRSNSAFSSP